MLPALPLQRGGCLMRPAVDPAAWGAQRRERIEQARRAAEERRQQQSLAERLEEIAREAEKAARRKGCARIDVPLDGYGAVMQAGGSYPAEVLPQFNARHVQLPPQFSPDRPAAGMYAEPPHHQPPFVYTGVDYDGPEDGGSPPDGEESLRDLQAARIAAHAEREQLRQRHGGAKKVLLNFGGGDSPGAAPAEEELAPPPPLGVLPPRLQRKASELQRAKSDERGKAGAEAAPPVRRRAPAAGAQQGGGRRRPSGAQLPAQPSPPAPAATAPRAAASPPAGSKKAAAAKPAEERGESRKAPLQQLQQQQLPQRAPHPKQKPADARLGGASKCVGEVERLARAREERRAKQAEERRLRDEAAAQSGGDQSAAAFRRMVADYRARLRAGKEHLGLPATAGGSDLTVCVRKRPLNQKEERGGALDCATCAGPSALVFHEPKLKFDLTRALENHAFCFDHVFDGNAHNADVYACVLGPHLRRPLRGALTVFAYGQTGSGKTYTMRALCGAAVGDLLRGAAESGLSCSVSAFEIYMGKVHDLLANRLELRMLEGSDGEIQVMGLTERPAGTAQAVEAAVAETERVRTTSANAVHNDSSRSHAVLQLVLRSSRGQVCGRLSLVDLAGSERAAETQTDGTATRLEGAEINKSLLALKECIRAAGRHADHVPYRGSLLTRALRGCFDGGTARWQQHTVVIATVSPTLSCADHSLNTLRYAARLKELRPRAP